jgi:4-methylaminobutanoate oxidase (formaldehyde-forming)
VCEEHQAVRERVGIFEMSSFGKVDVKGKGAFALLQKLTDSDLNKPVGSVTYTQMLNKRGGIESDLTLTRLGDDHFRLVTGSAFISRDIGWLEMQKERLEIRELEIRDCTAEYAVIGIWGPSARKTLQPTTRDDVSNAAFPYMTAKTIHIAGVSVLAQRVTYVGELGWELYVPFDQATVVWDALMNSGKASGIRPCGYKSLESLRLEKAYRYWSADITPADNPYEAGLGFCVNLDKGDFIGRDALVQAKANGIQRKLCTLTIDPNCVIYGGEAVMQDGKVVGRLRSGGYGYTVGINIGLVYLPIELAKQGTEYKVDVFGDLISAQVAPNVLNDPKGERLKQ